MERVRRFPLTLVLTWIVSIGLLLIVAGAFALLVSSNSELRDRLREKDHDVLELVAQYRSLYDEAAKGGVEPDAPAPAELEDNVSTLASPAGERGMQGIPGSIGPEGPPGPSGPPGLTGSTGAPGVDGQSVVGPAGPPGPVGPSGKDGAPGATGPAGESVVGPEGPVGPAGIPGADGVDGADGRGVWTLDCQPDGSWLVTYTDGTTSTTPGPCRATTGTGVQP